MILRRGVEGARTASRRLRSQFVSGGMTLLYHRVARPAEQPLQDPFRLCVSPERFEGHLRLLRERWELVPLTELTDRIESGRPVGGCVALTFDDGYRDNLVTARPLLERHGVPATFFVVAGALGRPFWWDELSAAVAAADGFPERLRALEAALGSAVPRGGEGVHGRVRWLRTLHRRLKTRAGAERSALLDLLEPLPHGAGPARALTADEVAALAADSIEIGAHGVTHAALAPLPPDEQERELAQSKATLESIVGEPVTSFSYPFGGPGDVSDTTVRLAEAAGFERACTTTTDVVTASTPALRLPRLWVRDWTSEELAKTLGGWMRR